MLQLEWFIELITVLLLQFNSSKLYTLIWDWFIFWTIGVLTTRPSSHIRIGIMVFKSVFIERVERYYWLRAGITRTIGSRYAMTDKIRAHSSQDMLDGTTFAVGSLNLYIYIAPRECESLMPNRNESKAEAGLINTWQITHYKFLYSEMVVGVVWLYINFRNPDDREWLHFLEVYMGSSQ